MAYEQQIVNKIEKLLTWYEGNCDKASVLQLLKFNDQLSLLSVNLASICAKAKASYLRTYFERKYTFSTKKIDWIKNGSSAAKADEQARLEIGAIKASEIEREEEADILNLMLRQINKVLSSAQQRISFEKAEHERAMRTPHDNT
tara:strand:+ start:2613 stop:3047 length:435 start_codon:yes stop_codon:yes gene_type:complete